MVARDIAGGCRPAAQVLGVNKMRCSPGCPFPFCVVEVDAIRSEMKKNIAQAMQKLGNTVHDVAREVGVSIRSAYRYADYDTRCVQCNLLDSPEILCKSDVYSVTHKYGQYMVILNKHENATRNDLQVVECFVDYVFPTCTMVKEGSGHDYWMIAKVEPEDVKRFESMCAALDEYLQMPVLNMPYAQHAQYAQRSNVRMQVGVNR